MSEPVSFRQQFLSRRAEITLQLETKKGHVSKPKLAKAHMPNLSNMKQAAAKKHIPPGSSIWRGTDKNTWHGHMPPYSRVTGNPAREGSEVEALHYVFRCLLTGWCILNGVKYVDCPLQKLFKQGYNGEDC